MRTSMIVLAAALCLAGCHKDTSLGGSGSAGTSAGTATGSTGSGSTGSGSTGSGSTAGSTGSAGTGSTGTSATHLDAGLAAYCAGHGAPIDVGDSSADAGRSATCAGNLAQRTFRFGLCTCEALSVSHPIQTDSFAYLDAGLPDGGAALTLVAGRNNGAVGCDQGVNEAPGANGVHLRVGGSLWVSDGGFTSTQSGYIHGELHAGSPVSAVTDVGADAYCAQDIDGAVNVAGDLHLPTSATVGSGVNVAGQVIRQPVSVADPCDCTHLVDIAGVVASHAADNDDGAFDGGLDPALWAQGSGPSSFTFPCGRYYLSGIDGGAAVTIASTTTWHIDGRTALLIDGDLVINAGFTLDVPPGSELDLFIAGNLVITAPTTLGTQASAANTRFYVGGADAIALDSPSGFYGNIYAPRAEIDFNSPGDIYGAVFARAFVNARPARLHYDEDILSAGAECVTGSDGGSPDTDGGVSSPDGGVPDSDGGPATSACQTCGDCNNQACIVPADGGPGACGACVTSADCCAPLSCVSGTCTVMFQ